MVRPSVQVLGAVLLLGVMGVFASCVVYVLPPGSITCAVRQWAPPLCLALCYGILLVKSMHLRALVTVGAEGEVGCCVLSRGNVNAVMFSRLLFSVKYQQVGHRSFPSISVLCYY